MQCSQTIFHTYENILVKKYTNFLHVNKTAIYACKQHCFAGTQSSYISITIDDRVVFVCEREKISTLT